MLSRCPAGRIEARASGVFCARTATPSLNFLLLLGDALFTGLRLVDGIDANAIQTRYGVDVWDRFGPDLQPFLEAGCLRRTESRLSLTRQGMLLAHEVMSVFV